MKRLPAIAIFALLISTLAGAAFAQVKGKRAKSPAPRTVEDFYKILPAKFYSYLEDQPQIKNRADLIGTIDIARGYLGFDNNRASEPRNGQILLLKRMSGAALLVLSYTDCCTDSLRFVEYKNGRWTEIDAAPPLEREKFGDLYRRRTGNAPGENDYAAYEISPTDKSISVKFGGAEIYKLEWDGNVYKFAQPIE